MITKVSIKKLMPTSVLIFLIITFYVLHLQASNTQLTVDETNWLSRQNGKIRIVDAPAWPPLAFIERTDRQIIFKGIADDYIKLLEAKINFKFQRVYPGTWQQLIDWSKEGKVEVVGCIQKTPQREEFFNFTTPYIEIPNVIVSHKDIKENLTLKELIGKKVAVGKGFAVTEYIKRSHPGIDIIECADDYSLLLSVANDEVFAAVSDKATVVYFLEHKSEKLSKLKISGEVTYVMKLGIGSSKRLPLLNRILQKGINSISPQEKKTIWQKWLKVSK
jgi:ABC-type amino acid transport substrate-binding protein